MRTLTDKVVVITGAASGIGRALALDAAARGAVLALSDVDEAGLAETARLVAERTSRDVCTDMLDVRDRDAVAAYAASVHERFGRVNVVVNNAGVALYGDFAEVTYSDFAWVMDIDFWGVVHGSKEFLPYLVDSGDGHLVNISSVFGLVGMPAQTAYNAAKFAVRGFTEALRQEMLVARHPVEVTCVHPGGVKTAIVRNARASRTEDKAFVMDLFDGRLARTSAEKAAAVILDGVLANRPRIVVGADAKILDALARLLGARYQRLIAGFARRLAPRRQASPEASDERAA
jgi:NAD(P)-dependent dehydrogenase (short-subunit alcohol dehydrogenase family)